MAMHAFGPMLFGVLSLGGPPFAMPPSAVPPVGAATVAHQAARRPATSSRIAFAGPIALRQPAPDRMPQATNLDERAGQQMLVAVNRERVANGRPPLVLDERLNALACAHALDMAARNYFSHETPEGLSPFDRMDRAAYRYEDAGENMALDSDAGAADRALWNSPEHRNNTLDANFSHVGIGAVKTPAGELFVEDFSD